MARNFGAGGNFGSRGSASVVDEAERTRVSDVVDDDQLTMPFEEIDEDDDDDGVVDGSSGGDPEPVFVTASMPRRVRRGSGPRPLDPGDTTAVGFEFSGASASVGDDDVDDGDEDDDVYDDEGDDVVDAAEVVADDGTGDDSGFFVADGDSDVTVAAEASDDEGDIVDYGDVMRRKLPIDMGLPLPGRIICVALCAVAAAVAAYLLAMVVFVGRPSGQGSGTVGDGRSEVVITGASGSSVRKDDSTVSTGDVSTEQGGGAKAVGSSKAGDGIEDTGRGYGVSAVGARRDADTGNITLTGSVQNLTSEVHESVAVGIYLYGGDGSILGIATDYVDRIEAGGTWEFKAVGDVAYDKVSRFELAEIRW